jgi:hypothetical protein
MGDGTRESPWVLRTSSGGSQYEMFRDEDADPPARRAAAGGGGHRRGLGPLARQSGRRLVRTQEGPARQVGMYVPPLLAELGLAEVEQKPRNNSMRAL